ncbi:MAG TPA: hypothetical protein VMU59_09245 [Caulobacteraceae bacterium]|nr:hypothetical protein [Caulobacteraceae bacterium]
MHPSKVVPAHRLRALAVGTKKPKPKAKTRRPRAAKALVDKIKDDGP